MKSELKIDEQKKIVTPIPMKQENLSSNSKEIPTIRPPRSAKYSENTAKGPNNQAKVAKNEGKTGAEKTKDEKFEINLGKDSFDDFFGSQQDLKFSYNPEQIYDLEEAGYQSQGSGQTLGLKFQAEKKRISENNAKKDIVPGKMNMIQANKGGIQETGHKTLEEPTSVDKSENTAPNPQDTKEKTTVYPLPETSLPTDINRQNMDYLKMIQKKTQSKLTDANEKRLKIRKKRMRGTKGSFFRKKLPRRLAGLKSAELRKVSGIDGLLYVNDSRNIAAAKSLTAILTLAEFSLFKKM